MTAVRAAARFAPRAVLAAVVLAAMLFTAYGPGGAWKLAWLLLVAVVTGCAALAWLALWPEGDSDG